MKKNLAKAVVLGLVCASVLSANAYAANKMDITASRDILYYGDGTRVDLNNDGVIKGFWMPIYSPSETLYRAIYIHENSDKTINLRYAEPNPTEIKYLNVDYKTSGGTSIGLENNTIDGKTTIKSAPEYGISFINRDIYSGQLPNLDKQYGILNTSGELEIVGETLIELNSIANEKIGAYNNSENRMAFSGVLDIRGINSDTTEIGIRNEGTFEFNGSLLKLQNNNTGIFNNSKTTINTEKLIIEGNDAKAIINNRESMLTITADQGILDGDIRNNGRLIFNGHSTGEADGESYFQISSNIYHGRNAETVINLSNDNNITVFNGKVVGSDLGGEFQLTIGKNVIWEASSQNEILNGLVLDGGSIQLNSDRYTFDSDGLPSEPWGSSYSTLNLKNLQASKGIFSLTTDLMNNVGDKIIFSGTIPSNANLGIEIWNNGSSGGKAHLNDGIHKVTIIEAPENSNFNFEYGLGFYGHYNEYMLFNPIIETEIQDNKKLWNFVGWGEGGHKTLYKEKDQEPVEPWINHVELDNTLKRINDIRTDPSEVGAWLRGENGKMKIRSYGYKYNLMSGGYDWKYESDAAKMFLGFGISYAKNNCDTGIIGDTKSMGYNLYGSWLGRENNDYVDVIVKYGTLDKKYAGLDDNNVFVTGDYDKKLFSIAAKYGRRITRDDGWYYEPSVGLTWGRIGSADFTDSQGIKIHADSSTSKMATLGMQVGKNIQGTEFYGLFQMRHDFDGKMHVSVPGSDLPGSSVYDDMGGTWYKVGIGAARKINKNNSFYMDIEKDFGNKVKKPYAIGAGYRYTF